ncbi:terpene synthase family protein [Algoriphagus sp.]|uniref:terpene synthase family protein n=1 Tax=Algoriphagus sp. TaxID=1872435 RepID=UPI003F712017
MSLSILPVSINLYTPTAEAIAIDWGWNYGLVDDELELKKEKTLWFAGYALPILDKLQIEETTKFFFCLHTLDDMLRRCAYEEGMEFFYRWEEYLFYQEFDSPFSSVWYALDDVMESMANLGDEVWLDTLYFYLEDYLQAKRWEFHNNWEGIIPGLNVFTMQRTYSSGIYLAIHFLKLHFPAEEYPIRWEEQRIARIVCLATDLKAFEFHRNKRLTHNELLLRQLHTGISDPQVCNHAFRLLSGLFDSLLDMLEEVKKENESHSIWVDQLLLLLGGCLYWSEEEALRYSTKINGISKI